MKRRKKNENKKFFIFNIKIFKDKKNKHIFNVFRNYNCIATIFILIALSQGLQYYVQSELNRFGNKAIFIFPGARAGFVSSISGYFTNSFIENIAIIP
ncbi:hypothetical protein [Candidatus Nanopusillus massiliensis]|uniref:hypothetical protein n=1 Tax=Candidatus Nanopusillus massiliensis TaxID=2897163 RepID=UPI001E3D4F14|nr:hypothetical protein [Candidatus Nanopusillus massiliensis]